MRQFPRGLPNNSKLRLANDRRSAERSSDRNSERGWKPDEEHKTFQGSYCPNCYTINVTFLVMTFPTNHTRLPFNLWKNGIALPIWNHRLWSVIRLLYVVHTANVNTKNDRGSLSNFLLINFVFRGVKIQFGRARSNSPVDRK